MNGPDRPYVLQNDGNDDGLRARVACTDGIYAKDTPYGNHGT